MKNQSRSLFRSFLAICNLVLAGSLLFTSPALAEWRECRIEIQSTTSTFFLNELGDTPWEPRFMRVAMEQVNAQRNWQTINASFRMLASSSRFQVQGIVASYLLLKYSPERCASAFGDPSGALFMGSYTDSRDGLRRSMWAITAQNRYNLPVQVTNPVVFQRLRATEAPFWP